MDHDNPVLRSLELMEKRVSDKITVENFAQAISFSKYHYQRLFHELVGSSVMEYVTKRKLTLAGRALLETNAAIIDIALEYGYESREGFARSFKAYMGVTPTEYRKYGLAAIKQNPVKERRIMTYSQTTDKILRELNHYIVQAKKTAEDARRHETSQTEKFPFTKQFWENIADKTDAHADGLRAALTRIADLAEHPDEITNRFSIINVIDDAAFISNVMALHVGISCARNLPEYAAENQPLCNQYVGLAKLSAVTAEKIGHFMSELSALIFEDMRKAAAEKIAEVIRKARAAADMIHGYDYIKGEITHMADTLEAATVSDASAAMLADYASRLQIISFSVDTDILRSGGRDQAMFGGMEPLTQSLHEAFQFYQSLPSLEPKEEPIHTGRNQGVFRSIAYQGNVLLFYTCGEIEKITCARHHDNRICSEEQQAAMKRICDKLRDMIRIAHEASDGEDCQAIANALREIHTELAAIADSLGVHGCVFTFISSQCERLEGAVRNLIKQ